MTLRPIPTTPRPIPTTPRPTLTTPRLILTTPRRILTTPPPSGLEGTLRVLIHQNPAGVEFFESFNDEFEAANPGVAVDLSIVEADALATTNQTRLTAKDIDVTTISLTGFDKAVQDYMTGAEPPAWQQLIDAGLIKDLTGEAFLDNYDEAAVDELVVQRRRLRGRARPHDLQRHVRERRPARRGRRRDADDVRRARRGLSPASRKPATSA